MSKLKGSITVNTRWGSLRPYLQTLADRDTNGRQAALVHPDTGTVLLPWWPDEIERGDLARVYSEFARPGRDPLLVPESKALRTYNVAFEVLNSDYGRSVEPLLNALETIADSEKPLSLVLARSSRGLYHATGLTITERDPAASGNPAWASVSMTLKRASDYTVKVGPVIRGKGRGMAKKG